MMITYRMMDVSCPLSSCLHKGPLPLSSCGEAAYVETVSDITHGSVARVLQAVSDRYGACGVLALDGEMVVGKIRAYPQAVIDRVPYPCVQQDGTIRPVMALELTALPPREAYPILHLYCIQVARSHAGLGIAGGMLDHLIAWTRANGWHELRARAVSDIPPLLNWCGQLSRTALERRGFVVTGSTLNPDLREGVVSQRGGYHGEAVKMQWEPFAHLSDDGAAQVFDMVLILKGDTNHG